MSTGRERRDTKEGRERDGVSYSSYSELRSSNMLKVTNGLSAGPD